MKLLGATQLSMKESEHQNSTFNANASGTKNSFDVTQDPKMETKMSKIEKVEKEKNVWEEEI